MTDRAEIEAKVADIIAQYIEEEDPQIVAATRLITDLGVDSLDLLDISFDIEQAFGAKAPIDEWTEDAELSAEDFVEMLTFGRIVDFILSARAA